MKINDIYKRLLEYNTPDRLQLIRAEYKGTDKGFIQAVTQILKEYERKYLFEVYDRVNLLYMNNQDELAQEYEKLNIPNPFIDTLRFELENFAPNMKEKKTVLGEKEYNTKYLQYFKLKGFEIFCEVFDSIGLTINTKSSSKLNGLYAVMNHKQNGQYIHCGKTKFVEFLNEYYKPTILSKDWDRIDYENPFDDKNKNILEIFKLIAKDM